MDDILETGTASFRDFTKKTNEVFKAKSICVGTGSFMGVQFEKDTKYKGIFVQMNNYISTISLLPVPSGFELFNSTLHKRAWVVHIRPSIHCMCRRKVAPKH